MPAVSVRMQLISRNYRMERESSQECLFEVIIQCELPESMSAREGTIKGSRNSTSEYLNRNGTSMYIRLRDNLIR